MPPIVSGISPAYGAALTGIRGSVDRFDAAAAEVTRSAIESENAAEPQDEATFSHAARSLAANGPRPDDSLENGLIDEQIASHDVAANVRVIRTADEVTKSLLDIVR